MRDTACSLAVPAHFLMPFPVPSTNPENWHQLSGKPPSWPTETSSLLLFPPAARS